MTRTVAAIIATLALAPASASAQPQLDLAAARSITASFGARYWGDADTRRVASCRRTSSRRALCKLALTGVPDPDQGGEPWLTLNVPVAVQLGRSGCITARDSSFYEQPDRLRVCARGRLG